MFKKNPLAAAISSATVASALAATGVALPTIAYGEAAQEIEEIVVTGSRIKRTDLEAVSPVSVVDQEEFTLSGILNIEQKLAELPQTLPSFGPSSNNPGDGTARVDLRGLGDYRTLVLVDGRRWINSTSRGITDLNTIPASLIESVDVVTGGASAVYGSDAVAGVVNFKLMDDFEGVEFGGLYDVATKNSGDADKKSFDVTIGGNFADGRGNAVVYGMYADRDALFQGDRSFSDVALVDDGTSLVAGGSPGIPGTWLSQGSPLIVTPPGGTPYELGRFLPDGSGAEFIDPDDLYNYAPANYLQLPQDTWMIFSAAHYDLADNARVYTQLTGVHNEVPQELAPTPAYASTIEVNPNSVFFAPEVQAALNTLPTNAAGNVELDLVGRRMVENGPRHSSDTRDGFRVLLGGTVDLTEAWTFDTYYMRNQIDYSQTLDNDVAETRFRQAVLTTDDGLACQDPSGGCVPMNIWGEGNISQEAVGFVNVGASNITHIKQQVFSASVTGDLGRFKIDPNNTIGVAIGYEYREEKSSFRPDEFLSAGDVLGFNAGEPTNGSYDVKEIYGEVDVPIVSGKRFMEYFGLWGAYRYSDYSTIDDVNTYAFNATYAPTETLRFRGGFQRAVRAPNIYELFLGTSNGFPAATDPCSSTGQPDLNNAALVSLCEQTGVAPGQVGQFVQPATQIEGLFGGNPDLTEEKSDTITMGLVYEPSWAEGLDFTLDYYTIEVKDAIDVLGGGVNNTLSLCYEGLDITSEYCQVIARRADNNVDTVTVLNANIGKLETEGFDFNVNYTMGTDWGLFGNGSQWSITYRANYMTKYDETPVQGQPTVYECKEAFGNTCGYPRPEYQSMTRLTWNTGPLTTSVLWRYYGESKDDRIENDGTPSSSLAVPKIDDINYFDLSGSWAFEGALQGLQLNMGVKNLTDEKPTKVGDVQDQANTFPEVYDVIGRRFFVSATYKL